MLKRCLDASLALMGLIATAPAWIVLMVAIKLEDGGPVFFGQDRWGKDGRKFRALKFRSMMTDAATVWGSVQAKENDPRITRIGRIMRRTALDELPQILNILKGDMSFVGPRSLPINERQLNDPHPDLPDDAVPNFAMRSHVRPGLTGLAQIYAPRDVSRRNKFRYDVLYVRRQGLLLDLRLILLSIWISLKGGWERRVRHSSVRSSAGA